RRAVVPGAGPAATRQLLAEELVDDRVGARVDAVDQVVDAGHRSARAGAGFGAVLPPGELPAAGHRTAGVADVAELPFLDRGAVDREPVLARRHHRALIPRTRPAAELRARDRMAVAALVLDRGHLLALGLLQRALDVQVREAGRRRATGERALLEGLLAREEVLDAGLADRLLAVVLAGVTEVLLL